MPIERKPSGPVVGCLTCVPSPATRRGRTHDDLSARRPWVLLAWSAPRRLPWRSPTPTRRRHR